MTRTALDARFVQLSVQLARELSGETRDGRELNLWIENRLTLHLQDGCPGKGRLDFSTLFRRMEALDGDYPVIAEGNSAEELPAVAELFLRVAANAGIRVLDADEEPEK